MSRRLYWMDQDVEHAAIAAAPRLPLNLSQQETCFLCVSPDYILCFTYAGEVPRAAFRSYFRDVEPMRWD